MTPWRWWTTVLVWFQDEDYLDMDENTINDMVNDSCVCVGELIVLGCTNTDACNYDESATDDDDSCELPGDACDDMDENIKTMSS